MKSAKKVRRMRDEVRFEPRRAVLKNVLDENGSLHAIYMLHFERVRIPINQSIGMTQGLLWRDLREQVSR